MRFEVSRVGLWKNSTPPITRKEIEDVITWMIIGTILGGRLGYVLFYQFDAFLLDPLRILRVWEGGMSFHGGFIGVITAALLYCRKTKSNPWSVGDLIASSSCFGLLFGRFANFINAELWGRPTDAPWGVAFPCYADLFFRHRLCDFFSRRPYAFYVCPIDQLVTV